MVNSVRRAATTRLRWLRLFPDIVHQATDTDLSSSGRGWIASSNAVGLSVRCSLDTAAGECNDGESSNELDLS
jgi:hypothetical protein